MPSWIAALLICVGLVSIFLPALLVMRFGVEWDWVGRLLFLSCVLSGIFAAVVGMEALF